MNLEDLTLEKWFNLQLEVGGDKAFVGPLPVVDNEGKGQPEDDVAHVAEHVTKVHQPAPRVQAFKVVVATVEIT